MSTHRMWTSTSSPPRCSWTTLSPARRCARSWSSGSRTPRARRMRSHSAATASFPSSDETSRHDAEARHGFAGARPSGGGLGAIGDAEARHGFAGARPSGGGLGAISRPPAIMSSVCWREDRDDRLARARALASFDPHGALALVESVLAEVPDDPEALRTKGAVLVDVADAERDSVRAVALYAEAMALLERAGDPA